MDKQVAQTVVERAAGKCEICYRTDIPLHLHHKQFRSQGGEDSTENLQHICFVCHEAQHGILLVWNGHSCNTCYLSSKCSISQSKQAKQEKKIPKEGKDQKEGDNSNDFIFRLFGDVLD